MGEGAIAYFLALRTLHPEEITQQPPPSSKSSAVLENHPHPLVERLPTLCWQAFNCDLKSGAFLFCYFRLFVCLFFHKADVLNSICGLEHVQKDSKCKVQP